MCAQRKIQPAIPENVRAAIVTDVRVVAKLSRDLVISPKLGPSSMIGLVQVCGWCKKIKDVHITGKSYMEDEEKRVYPRYCNAEKNSLFKNDPELSQWSSMVYKLYGGI